MSEIDRATMIYEMTRLLRVVETQEGGENLDAMGKEKFVQMFLDGGFEDGSEEDAD